MVNGVLCVHPAVCARSPSGLSATVAQLVVDGYDGFNIIRQFGQYYAIPQLGGPFFYERFMAHGYEPAFKGSTLAEVESLVDKYVGKPGATAEDNTPHLTLTDPEGVQYVQYRRRFFALPPNAGTFDPVRFTNGEYHNVVSDASLQQAQASVSAIRATYLRPGEFKLSDGFYPSEGKDGALLPRWSGGQAALTYMARGGDEVVLNAQVVQPLSVDAPTPDLALVLDGSPITPERWSTARIDPGRFRITVRLAPRPRPESLRQLLLLTPTFVPSRQQPPSQDARELGVLIEDISITEGRDQLRFRDVAARPPLAGASRQIVPELYIWSGKRLNVEGD
jgi:hypothetical protein